MPRGGPEARAALAELEAAKAVLARSKEKEDEPTSRLVRAILKLHDIVGGSGGW